MSKTLTVGGAPFVLPATGGLGKGPDTIGWATAVTAAIASGTGGSTTIVTSANNTFVNAADIGILPANTGAQNLAAWELWQHSFPPPYSGNAVYFPKGIYDFSNTFVIRHTYRIMGAGGWAALNTDQAPTTFRFPAGVNGVKFETFSYPWANSTAYIAGIIVYWGLSTYECITSGTSSSTFNAGLSGTSQDITDGTCHWKYLGEGAYDRADFSSLEDVFLTAPNTGSVLANGVVMKVRGALTRVGVRGFRGNGVNIAAGVEGTTNANGWIMNTVRVSGCGGHGVYIKGGDVNAGTSIGLDIDSVGGWGLYEDSFLGNTHIGPQVAFAVLGAVYCQNASARNIFIGLYTEGGQPPAVINFPSMALGGLQGAGLIGTGMFLVNDNIGNAVSYGEPDVIWSTGNAYDTYGHKVTNYTNKNIYRLVGAGTSAPFSRVWTPARIYTETDRAFWGTRSYECITGGTSSATVGAGLTGTGTNIVDGTCHWTYLCEGAGTGPEGTGSSIADGTCLWAWSSAPPGRTRIKLGTNFTNNADLSGSLILQREANLYEGNFSDNIEFLCGDNQNGWNNAYSASYTSIGLRTAFYIAHSQTTFPSKLGKYVLPGEFGMPTGYYIGTTRVDVAAAVPDTGTWDVGDRTLNSAPVAGGFEGWVVTTKGTLLGPGNTPGVYSETKTMTGNGTTTVVLSAPQGNGFFTRGMFITVGGVACRIVSISGTTFVLDTVISSGAGKAVAYQVPVFKTYGAISS